MLCLFGLFKILHMMFACLFDVCCMCVSKGYLFIKSHVSFITLIFRPKKWFKCSIQRTNLHKIIKIKKNKPKYIAKLSKISHTCWL